MGTLRRLFSLDPRSLGAFRILLGAIALLDYAYRWPNLQDFYSDKGFLPRSLLMGTIEIPWKLSLLNLNGSLFWAHLLCAIGMLAALALLLGVRSRLAIFICWVVTCSFTARNPLVIHGGDNLLRLLLFWGFFLPLDSEFALERSPGTANPVFSAALILQVCFIYLFTSIYKMDPAWTERFDAIYYALNVDAFVTPLGVWLRGYPTLMRAMTAGTILLESLGPLLLFVPWRTPVFRTIACLSFIAFHTGLATTIELGNFPWACIAAWVALLPGEFWKTLVDWTPAVRWHALARNIQRSRPARLVVRMVGRASPPFLRPMPRSHAAFGAISLIVVLAWNVEGMGYMSVASPWKEFAFTLQLNQQWNMFAPAPMKNDGWFVMAARAPDGSETDLLRGGLPVSWTKPERVADLFPDSQWRKLLLTLSEDSVDGQFREVLAKYFCRKAPKGTTGIRFIFLEERTPPPGPTGMPTDTPSPVPVPLAQVSCS